MSDEMNRREFFRSSLFKVRKNLADVVESQLERFKDRSEDDATGSPPEKKGRTVVRPPGALPETEFLATCERCRKCVDVCPLYCIIPSQPGMAAELGTPYLLPEEAPCDFCHECVDACPSGALQPFDKTQIKIGTAVIEPLHCLISHGETCDICVQACPRSGEAIAIATGDEPTIDETQARLPVVVAEACTGCGFCGEACPAPARAITVFPV